MFVIYRSYWEVTSIGRPIVWFDRENNPSLEIKVPGSSHARLKGKQELQEVLGKMADLGAKEATVLHHGAVMGKRYCTGWVYELGGREGERES